MNTKIELHSNFYTILYLHMHKFYTNTSESKKFIATNNAFFAFNLHIKSRISFFNEMKHLNVRFEIVTH